MCPQTVSETETARRCLSQAPPAGGGDTDPPPGGGAGAAAPRETIETTKSDTGRDEASCCSGAAVARYRHAADGREGRAREVEKFVAVAVVWQIRNEQLSCVSATA